MRSRAQNLFAVTYRNVPGKGVFAQGGLKFQTEESAMRRQYAAVLRTAPLEVLLGEASLWVLWPSTAAIWAFPLLLWRFSTDVAVLAAIGLFLAVQIAHMLFYRQWLNYAGFVLGNRALQGLVYAGSAAGFWFSGQWMKALALAAWLLLMATGVVQVVFTVPFLPLLTRLFSARPADQALWNVACTHARRTGIPVRDLQSAPKR